MGATRRTPTEDLADRLRVRKGERLDITAIDAGETHGWTKEAAAPELERGLTELADLQERLWAERRHAVLIVLQGMDTSGKGGVIEHVMGAFNPAGCPVSTFRAPSEAELAHDYLWRVHPRTPGRGEIAIWDRSHYEDVLIVRVRELVPRERWSRRYRHIEAFERLLADEGTTIVKFMLHIDREEQRERLQVRLDNPSKRWKFRLGDLDERKRWDDHMAAYAEALERTSADRAPWFVIPANEKWFRNLAVASIVAGTLRGLDPRYPEPEGIPPGLVVE